MSLPKPKILIIEDDIKLARVTSEYLQEKGYAMLHAEYGELGLELAEKHQPALIILDLMMPVMDGITVCRHLQRFYKGKIIVLTASDDDIDQVTVLEIGADDFVSKPIHPRVLLARIRVLLRRTSAIQTDEKAKQVKLRYGELAIDKSKRRASLKGQELNLTDSEFEMLWVLASQPEITLTRDQIMQELRGIEYDGINRTIDNKIAMLRKKLGDDLGIPKRIITVRGKGYMFVTDPC